MPLAKRSLILIFSALLTMGLVRAATAEEALPSISYAMAVSLDKGELTLEGIIRQTRPGESLCVPAFGQRKGESLLLGPLTADGKPYAAIMDAKGCFMIDAAYRVLHIPYTLKLAKAPAKQTWLASSLSARRTTEGLYISGESLFFERKHSAEERVHLRVKVDGGAVASTLPLESHEAQVEASALTAAYFAFVPTWHYASITNGASDIQLYFEEPPRHVPLTRLNQAILRLLTVYELWAPKRMPSHLRFIFLTRGNAKRAAAGFTRSGGIVMQWDAQMPQLGRQALYALAHEIFHLYNGEGFRFAHSHFSETAWFREGMTNYVALSALLESGLISCADGNAEALRHAKLSAEGLKAAVAPAHLPYNLGFIMSLILDVHLREGSEQKRSIPGYWRFLAQSSLWQREQTPLTLQQSLLVYSSTDYTSFMDAANAAPLVQHFLEYEAYFIGKWVAYYANCAAH